MFKGKHLSLLINATSMPNMLLQNRYRIVRPFGQGGMGAVYEAIDERLGKTVAVKELMSEDDKLRRAFEREARLLAHLSHPSLPRVTDYFVEGIRHYLVMDFIPGDDLKKLLFRRRAPFPVKDVLRWWDELLETLEYIHGNVPPIIHRDIKPANLKLLPNGRIALLDFGLAKGGAGQTQSVTMSRSVFGYSPHYAPLEQIRGTGTEARSDLYSLSATICHFLTGVMPPDALTRAAAVFADEQDPLLPVVEGLRNVPVQVVRLIRSGMELKTTARPKTASEMRAGLKNLYADDPAGADEEVTILTHAPQTEESAQPSASDDAPLPRDNAKVPPSKVESPRQRPRTLIYRRPLLAVVILCILAAVSSSGYLLITSRGARSEGAASGPPDDRPGLSPQLKPSSSSAVLLVSTNAGGQAVAFGGGFFVTTTEAVVPLSALEGASTVIVSASGERTLHRVLYVTRVDRERGVAVVKIEGKSGTALNIQTSAPPNSGEKVKLLGLNIDSSIRSSDGIIIAPDKSTLEVQMTEQSVGAGWLALRESGDFVGLLIARGTSGDFALFTPSDIAELMRKKVVQTGVEVAGANDILYDFRDADISDPPQLEPEEQAPIIDAVFGPRRPSVNDPSADCEGKTYNKCLAADRAAGRIEPEVLAQVQGAFTRPDTKQVAYLIAAHEEHSTEMDNFGTKWLAIFDGQQLVVNINIGDYWWILKTYDLNRDGTSELLLAGNYSQMDGTVLWAKLVDVRGNKLTVVKDFDKVYMDDCDDMSQDTRKFGTLIFYTPRTPGNFPSDFRQDIYRSSCGADAIWKYLAYARVPAI
jgi:Serine/threonine protein kinase